MHCVQLLAPVVEPVIEPAAHSMHDALYDIVEYVPIGHAVHALAPALLPVLVIEPDEQNRHDGALEAAEYRPIAHAVQELAPAAELDPAEQSEQSSRPTSAWCLPASHATHALLVCVGWR